MTHESVGGARARTARSMSRMFDRMRSSEADAVAGAPPAGTAADLHGHKHLLLVTYRRDGRAVPTPVWFGHGDDGALYCRSGAADGKVKRIRNNRQVLVAPCDHRGSPLGPPFAATADIVSAADEPAAEAAIRANFGLGRRIYKRLLGDAVPAAYVRVTPAGAVSGG